MNIIIAFSSRNASMCFTEALRKGGVPSTLVNTPRDLSLGCGISVSVETRFTSKVQELLRVTDKRSYLGTYKLMKSGNKTVVIPMI